MVERTQGHTFQPSWAYVRKRIHGGDTRLVTCAKLGYLVGCLESRQSSATPGELLSYTNTDGDDSVRATQNSSLPLSKSEASVLVDSSSHEPREKMIEDDTRIFICASFP